MFYRCLLIFLSWCGVLAVGGVTVCAQDETRPIRSIVEPDESSSSKPTDENPRLAGGEDSSSQEEALRQRNLVRKVLDFFGIESPKTTGLKRGHRDIPVPKLDIWVLDLKDGETRFDRITKDGGYRSPIFDSKIERIFALKRQHLVELDIKKDGRNQLKRTFDLESVQLILAATENELGYLDDSGNVWLLSLDSGSQKILVEGLETKHQQILERATRRCSEGKVVEDQAHRIPSGIDFHAVDVLLSTDERNAVARNLTSDLDTPFNLDPAISRDCRRVVMVAGDWD